MKDVKLGKNSMIWFGLNQWFSLSKKHSISDNGLRKICKKMNIPFPKNGYWQKLRYGKRLFTTALPSEYSSKEEINLSLREKAIKVNSSPPSPLEILQKEIEQKNPLLIIP